MRRTGGRDTEQRDERTAQTDSQSSAADSGGLAEDRGARAGRDPAEVRRIYNVPYEYTKLQR